MGLSYSVKMIKDGSNDSYYQETLPWGKERVSDKEEPSYGTALLFILYSRFLLSVSLA